MPASTPIKLSQSRRQEFMKKIIYSIYISLLFFSATQSHAQEAIGLLDQQSQFYINPATIGTYDTNVYFGLNALQPAEDLNVNNQFLAASMQMKFFPIEGLYGGIQLNRNTTGIANVLRTQLQFAYRKNIFSNWSIGAGIQANFMSQNLDLGELSIDLDSSDPSFDSSLLNDVKLSPNLGAGIVVKGLLFELGLSYQHIFQDTNGLNPSIFNAYLQVPNIPINSILVTHPRLSWYTIEGADPLIQIQLPVHYQKKWIAGPVLRYQPSEASFGKNLMYGLQLGVELQSKLQLMYVMQSLSTNSGALLQHQLGLQYRVFPPQVNASKEESKEKPKENKKDKKERKSSSKKKDKKKSSLRNKDQKETKPFSLFKASKDKKKKAPKQKEPKQKAPKKKAPQQKENAKAAVPLAEEKVQKKKNIIPAIKIETTAKQTEEDAEPIDLAQPFRIDFQKSESALSPSNIRELSKLVRALEGSESESIELVLFTDCSGRLETNQQMAQKRKQAIVTFFENQGISEAKISSRFKVEFADYTVLFGGVKEESRAKVIQANLLDLGIQTNIVYEDEFNVYRVQLKITEDYDTVDSMVQDFRAKTGISDIWMRSDCDENDKYRFAELNIR